MKKLILILTLPFSILVFSLPSYAEWTKIGENVKGNTFYVDFERIRKQGGYVYWWDLNDLLKPDKDGDLSYTIYTQGDCKLFRYKSLSEVYYKQNMGKGTPSTNTQKNPQWEHPPPNSMVESILKEVCSR